MTRKLFKKSIEETLAKFSHENLVHVEDAANFFGQESKGSKQIRGNGVLILTKKEIFFQMWTPRKTLRIPLESIKKIETPKSFLHKSRFKPLLKVSYLNEMGEIDAAAWLVVDLERTTKLLEDLLSV